MIVSEHEKFVKQQMYIEKQKEFQKRQLELQRQQKTILTDPQQTKVSKPLHTKDAKKRNDQSIQSPSGNERQNKKPRGDHVIDVYDADDIGQRSPDQKARQSITASLPLKELDTSITLG